MNRPFDIICLQGDSMTWTEQLPKTASGLYLPRSQPLTAYGGWGEMLFQSVQKEHFGIWSNNYDIKLPRSFEARGDVKLLEFSMQMDGNAAYKVRPLSHQTVKNSQFNIFYLPFMDSRASFEAGQRATTLDIHFTFEYLSILAEPFPDIIVPFLDSVKGDTPVQIFPKPLFATNFMLSLAGSILQLLKAGHDNDYLLELNVKTLISYALTCKYELNPKKKRISLEQISRIHTIRNKLATDFSQTPRLEDLARQAYMSLPRFKVLFKDIVQEAPYRFWMNNRLNMARKLLLTTTTPILDIAYELEFPDIFSFSKAFNNRFGLSPRELREKNPGKKQNDTN